MFRSSFYDNSFFTALIALSGFVMVASGQTQWQKYHGNPVLSPVPQNGIIGYSDPALLFDGVTLHLWITGGGFVPGDMTAGVRTYYYTSKNGFSWQPHPSNPVFREGIAGTWDSGHIETPSVIVSGEEFWLYYAATPDSSPDDGTRLKIGQAKSLDGSTWQRHPANPILERGALGSWEERWIESPCVLKTDSLFYMWYSGIDAEWRIHVGLATSADGIIWQKHPANPVFSPTRGSEWDSVGVYAPQVRRLENHFIMLYTGIVFSETGYDFANARTGMAVSEDGLRWTRVSNEPVFHGTPDAWDASGAFTLDWIKYENQLLMVYVSDGHVGMATSPIPSNVESESKQPDKPILFQNYPNPFNPETTIEYSVREACEVRLDVYDIAGREVATLVNDFYQPGFFKVSFDAGTLASGVYFYRIRMKDFTAVKKMVFLQ